MSLDILGEMGAVVRLANGLGQRHDVTPAECLAYHQRKAALLVAIAERDGDVNACEAAANARRQVQDLEMAGE